MKQYDHEIGKIVYISKLNKFGIVEKDEYLGSHLNCKICIFRNTNFCFNSIINCNLKHYKEISPKEILKKLNNKG